MLANIGVDFFSLIRGALLLLFLVNLGLYFQNKRKLFLFYSLYLAFVNIYLIWTVLFAASTSFIGQMEYFFLIISFVFYVEFERLLLKSRTTLPVWDVYFRTEKKLLVFTALCFPLVGAFLGERYIGWFLMFLSSSIGLFTVVSYAVILKLKEPTVKYFVLGSFSYILIANVGAYITVFNEGYFFGIQVATQTYMYLGILIEAMFFIYIIGYRIKNILEEGAQIKIQNALKLKEVAELKMIALQSQMNPHFLFNSLNSINNYVLKKDKEEASDYIGSFAKLVRQILKNSSSLAISLREEIEVLDNYVALEKKRLPGGFLFEKKINSDVDLNKVAVPPLFLQPFVENSIWHGLAGIKGEKKIVLKIFIKKKEVRIILIDNGVGLQKNKLIPPKSEAVNTKSFATVATKKRLELMHTNETVTMSVENLEKEPGIEVNLVFPFTPIV